MAFGFSSTFPEEGKLSSTIFSKEGLARVEKGFFEEKEKTFLTCLKRRKKVQAKPEEVVRQLVLDKLMNEYNYPEELLQVEHPVSFGRETRFADVVVLNKADKTSVYCVVEVKKTSAKDGREQLKGYTHATGAPLAVWTNGVQMDCYERLDPNYFEPITDIPRIEQTIDDVKKGRFTTLDLMKKDRLKVERSSLEEIVKGLEDEVLANAGVDVFEEVFKLLFTKLFDEIEGVDDIREIRRQTSKLKRANPSISEDEVLERIEDNGFRNLEFRSRGDAHHNRDVVAELFERAKRRWKGIFGDDETIKITDENHLKIAVAYLQDVKIYNSNLFVIDKAFEYLINKSMKGEKGQYFTPRNVIDMCVYMLNPKVDETMVDPACGSCGFTVHTLANVWEKIVGGKPRFQAHFHGYDLNAEQKDYINNVFGIDFDEKSVRVAKALNMIAGDGKTNVLHLNTLDYSRWEERKKDNQWLALYNEGYQRLLKLAKDQKSQKKFCFDIVMANPPFAGGIKDKRLMAEYELAYRDGKKIANSVDRDVLFIERNLDLLKPGGRMAIVLPQGIFNNVSDARIREFVMERARVLAVVGLDGNTFKPHTGTKTSVLFVQKWCPETNPEVEDYPIFMAVSECSGKDTSGEELYEIDENGRKTDGHGHLVQKHDLQEIAEAFEDWAKKQNLSFWSD